MAIRLLKWSSALKLVLSLAALILIVVASADQVRADDSVACGGKSNKTIYDFTVKNIHNEDVKLDKYKGKVLIVINVASECSLTKRNLQELNELYPKYKDQGLAILGFPSNQFGQEPLVDSEITEFMKKNNVEWDYFAKIDVNGDNSAPLYKWLKCKQGGFLIDAIKWNYTKFLINKQGLPVGRFSPTQSPKEFEDQLKAELAK